ncbi:microviridin/marinostatin family tricyclic proteinase inhibitor [Nostoc sp. 'Peltigera malacea cyanobiont' DB3992]|uniref:microviridin/marinostatin family tricyclic proteinase inhibitor n=1 Tax=Nostoc sp. 'Peltigera malacea cyanobiont' DB3992 TaxID=1206980 RepID=UPI00211DFB32|nr:microviridin/marinostatin family tricyclic proteinase inhibitor [Nostoc sp. 'Peltigera malacea cyanobiont' DB3992]
MMSEIKPEDLNSQAVPFFARFLEGQKGEDLSDQESEAISGGQTFMTEKYPSDSEDGVVATKSTLLIVMNRLLLISAILIMKMGV